MADEKPTSGQQHSVLASVAAAILSVFRELWKSFDAPDAVEKAKEKLAYLAKSNEINHDGLKGELDGALDDMVKLQAVHKEHAEHMAVVAAYVNASHEMHRMVPTPPEKLHGQK
jgi:hypothetical protein